MVAVFCAFVARDGRMLTPQFVQQTPVHSAKTQDAGRRTQDERD